MDPGLIWTFVGLTISFIIFVVVLHYLLYKPVSRILKERKDAMEADLRRAEELRAEAEQLRAEAEKHEQELAAKRDEILQETRDQAEQQRKELPKEAEDQARAKVDRFRRIMKQERDDLLAKITDELRGTILQIAGAVVSADAEQLADHGIQRVESLLNEVSSEDLANARKMLGGQDQRVQVLSAGPLNQDQLSRLKKIIAGKLSLETIELDAKEDASLVAGLEVSLGHLNLAAHWQGVIDEAMRQND